MRISHSKKFIFFSNPKTGSESMRYMLDKYSEIRDVKFKYITEKNPYYSHIRPVEVKSIFNREKIDFKSYTKIVCTRNPYVKLVSLYEMIFSKSIFKPNFTKWLLKTSNKGFGAGKDKPHMKARVYGTYCLKNFISDENGKILVDEIIPLENFKILIPKLFKKLNIPYKDSDMIKINSRKRKKDIKDYYTSEAIDYVKKNYAWEINKFSYTLPE